MDTPGSSHFNSPWQHYPGARHTTCMSDSARLWIVATPIGNLGDFSPRSAEVLAAVDVIAAEDTRHTAKLLAHAGIRTPMLSLHEHNEAERNDELLARLRAGESVAVVSDAGTPLISDPGFGLVRRARQEGIDVRCVPGPCAAIAALSIAGLPTDRFVFEGFLPHKAGPRRARLGALAAETATLVLYESSHRITALADDLVAVFGGGRQVALARELTKMHEDCVVCDVTELPAWLAADSNNRRGEFVVVLGGAPPHASSGHAQIELDALLEELLAVTRPREAVRIAMRLTGLPRNQVYARAMVLRDGPGE